MSKDICGKILVLKNCVKNFSVKNISVKNLLLKKCVKKIWVLKNISVKNLLVKKLCKKHLSVKKIQNMLNNFSVKNISLIILVLKIIYSWEKSFIMWRN